MNITQLLLAGGIAQPICVSAKPADADRIIDLGDGLRLTLAPGTAVAGDTHTFTYDHPGAALRTPARRYPGDGNRHERRKAAAERRRRGHA